jgi:hypothetical protein
MRKNRMTKLQMKAVMIVFFDIRGIIMIEWVLEALTVNQKYHMDDLTKL